MDLVGTTDVGVVLRAVGECTTRNVAAAQPFASARPVEAITGYVPARMIPDPAGYFVVYVDRARHLLVLEHYRKDGVLDVVVEGRSAADLYTPAVSKELVSRLDHAAYLGRELARAEQALLSGTAYVQDAAPERQRLAPETCGCDSTCTEVSS